MDDVTVDVTQQKHNNMHNIVIDNNNNNNNNRSIGLIAPKVTK